MWGTDHKSSLEVHAMDLLKKRLNGVIGMLGDSEKKITDSEKSYENLEVKQRHWCRCVNLIVKSGKA